MHTLLHKQYVSLTQTLAVTSRHTHLSVGYDVRLRTATQEAHTYAHRLNGESSRESPQPRNLYEILGPYLACLSMSSPLLPNPALPCPASTHYALIRGSDRGMHINLT
ncbi:hypothetical protein E2C01_027900 [Portunus trituberculatus]|uniref:Uncharacterized protein n=1 Tax=Portunus trituberculatus TaxID=210409 RepID=A0A5B7EMF2_PORTR|nr:hypothetical protein [Portunus trituberculatus]